ncbi:hypothetical protein PF010_g4082 [Phytophthora fragariae]|nr:hypothetical protein PF011_g5381 [Phytophthora fragariae]KAE9129779.1 hypothetical protein PF010_g4082 [Phytophthora fragariae]KAE9243986.1 hypothetical protein PF004_g5884 [Phytophthora fragariae]
MYLWPVVIFIRNDTTGDTIANGFEGVLKESSEEDDEEALL